MSNQSDPGAKVQRVWDSCRERIAAETARKTHVAIRVREVAQKLGAIPGEEDGVWELACPYCGQITYISEGKGYAFVRAVARRSCPATALIAQRVRASL
jgi:hypothetical protein